MSSKLIWWYQILHVELPPVHVPLTTVCIGLFTITILWANGRLNCGPFCCIL